jgi:hypothetical protein
MNQIEKVKKLSAEYDAQQNDKCESRLVRLKYLVDTHGVSLVAASAGLKESSVVQLSRVKGNAQHISERRLAKAESILASL